MSKLLGLARMLPAFAAIFLGGVAWAQEPPGEKVVEVSSVAQLRAAVAAATPGTTIKIAPGTYPGNLHFSHVRGQEGAPIVIEAADPENPPVFRGGTQGLHFANPAYLVLRNVTVTGVEVNGINIDDGGSYAFTAHDIVLERIHVTDVDPSGNHDGIKLSGLLRVQVIGCLVDGWGGSAIDMVGVHDALITGCVFRNQDDVGTGVQAKGGSSRVQIVNNRFEHAGHRAVNIGGSTGLQFFRPPLDKTELPYAEAREIVVQGNTFIGSNAPVAFVGVDGAEVKFNTIYRPKRWIVRILQETTSEGFAPSRGGIFESNIVVWRTDELSTAVNIGPNTAPESFTFARNWWYALDNPAASAPELPTEPVDSVIGIDPLLVDPEAGDLRLRPDSPVRDEERGRPVAGAEALE